MASFYRFFLGEALTWTNTNRQNGRSFALESLRCFFSESKSLVVLLLLRKPMSRYNTFLPLGQVSLIFDNLYNRTLMLSHANFYCRWTIWHGICFAKGTLNLFFPFSQNKRPVFDLPVGLHQENFFHIFI